VTNIPCDLLLHRKGKHGNRICPRPAAYVQYDRSKSPPFRFVRVCSAHARYFREWCKAHGKPIEECRLNNQGRDGRG
jgi:hypothetical protein